MSVWHRIQHDLPSECQRQIYYMYRYSVIPIEIRQLLAQWIEQQEWSWERNLHNYNQKCETLLNNFLIQLETIFPTSDLSYIFLIEDFMKMLQRSIETKNFKIVPQINECLGKEKAILQRHLVPVEILDSRILENLSNSPSTQSKQIPTLQVIKEKIDREAQTIQLLARFFGQQIEVDRLTSELGPAYLTQYIQLIQEIAKKYSTILTELNLHRQLLQFQLAKQRKTSHRRIGLDSIEFQQFVSDYQEFAHCVCSLFPYIDTMINLLKLSCNAEFDELREHCNSFYSKVRKLVQELLNQSLIMVEVSPVIVSPANAQSSPLSLVLVLFLAANIIYDQPPSATIQLIREYDANHLESLCSISDADKIKIDNNTVDFEFDSVSRIWKAGFSDLRMNKIDKPKNISCSLWDTKHAFLLSTRVRIKNSYRCGDSGEWSFDVQSISEPTILITKSSQKIRALATIFWDRSFALPARTQFEVPQSVPFRQLATALSNEFYEETGRHLTEENIRCLEEKLFGIHEKDDRLVTMQMFADQIQQEYESFTFWEWFHAALDLIVNGKHLKEIWCQGLLMGFVSESRAHELLANSPIGTILLYFSEEMLGSISVAFSTLQHSECLIHFTNPLNREAFTVKPLPDRIRALMNLGLKFIYPDIPLTSAFSQFYTNNVLASIDPKYSDNCTFPKSNTRCASPIEFELMDLRQTQTSLSDRNFPFRARQPLTRNLRSNQKKSPTNNRATNLCDTTRYGQWNRI